MLNVFIDPVATGKNIKKFRKAKKIKVREIAKMLGLYSFTPVYNWENGENLPRLDNFFALCKILDVTPMDICMFYDAEYAKQIEKMLKGYKG